jgi:hypothetical protein
MRLGTWNVRSLYRAGSLVTVSKELSNYRLDLLAVQVGWEGGGTKLAEECTFFFGKGIYDNELGTGFFVHKRHHFADKWGSLGRYSSLTDSDHGVFFLFTFPKSFFFLKTVTKI